MGILRSRVKSLAVICLIYQCVANAWAQNYPARVVRYLVPDSAGSGGDIISRIIAAGLTEVFGQQVIVDNRAGASSNLGAEIVAKAPADGYTLLAVSSTLSSNASLYRNLPYDLVRDLAPVTQLVLAPHVVVVHPSLPVKSIADLVKLAKANPGAINYSSAGAGTATFVPAELFKGMVAVDMVHVPYKGGGPALMAVVSGEAPVYFAPVVTSLPHIRQGTLRALAVTSAQRFPLLPELPTVAEAGVPGYDFSNSFGLMVPAKTPNETIALIHRATVTVLNKPDVIKRINSLGGIPIASQPNEYAAYVKNEIAMLAELFRKVGVTAD